MKKVLESVNCFNVKDRNKSYLTFVEACPWWLSLIILFLFLFILVVSVTVMAIVQPPVTQRVKKEYPYNTNFLFYGNDTIQVNIGEANPTHQSITLIMHMDNRLFGQNSSFTFTKNDLLLSVKVEGRLFGRYQTVFNEKAKTTLTCNQKRKECVAFIMNISPIHFDSYQIKIGVENGASLLSNGLVGEQVYFTYSFTESVYTVLTIIFRSVFIVLSVVFSVIYFTLLIRRQQFYYWSTEQKFISILLLLTVLYNNPTFFLEFVASQWIFQYINFIFSITFYTFLMLSVLVMTHSVITTPSDRGILWFFMPKFMIVGSIWMFTISVYTVFSFTATIGDFTVGLGENTSGLFLPFFFVLLVLLGIFMSTLVFYLVRAIGKCRSLPRKLIQKSIFFWLFTIITLALIVADVILSIARVNIGALQFNIFLIAFNAYTLSVSILYFPTNSVEFKNEKEEEEEKQSMLRSDEPFEDFE